MKPPIRPVSLQNSSPPSSPPPSIPSLLAHSNPAPLCSCLTQTFPVSFLFHVLLSQRTKSGLVCRVPELQPLERWASPKLSDSMSLPSLASFYLSSQFSHQTPFTLKHLNSNEFYWVFFLLFLSVFTITNIFVHKVLLMSLYTLNWLVLQRWLFYGLLLLYFHTGLLWIATVTVDGIQLAEN